MNRLLLSATMQERGALRYTPAGLPVLDMVLTHRSEVQQAGHPRQVSLEIKAVAIGDITAHLGRLALGSQGSFAGFLASARNGRGSIFHVTEWAEAADSPT